MDQGKELLYYIKMLENYFIDNSSKFNWSREKKVIFFRSLNRVVRFFESPSFQRDIDIFRDTFFNSIFCELYDVKPNVRRMLGDSSDKFYSLSLKRANDHKELIDSFREANLDLYDRELIRRLKSEYVNQLTYLGEEFQYFNWDVEKVLEGVSSNVYSSNAIIQVMIKFKLEFVSKNLDYWLQILQTKGSLVGATNVQILKSLGETYLSGLKPDVIIQPFPYFMIGNYKVKLSKSSSDRYVVNIIGIINEQLKLRGSEPIKIPNQFQDQRIRVGATPTDIRNYFYQLNTIIGEKTGQPIISKQSIDKFLGNSFMEFDMFYMNDLIKLDIKKGHIRYFIHTFYKKYDNNKSQGQLKKYVELLKSSFEEFKDDNSESLYKHFSRLPPKGYPF